MKKFLLSTLLVGAITFTTNAQKVYTVDYESRADLKIYFVDYESRAGWKNSSKKHLMY